jgi:hypothetical protein
MEQVHSLIVASGLIVKAAVSINSPGSREFLAALTRRLVAS